MLLGIFLRREKILTTGLSPSLVQDSAASSHLTAWTVVGVVQSTRG